MSIQFDHLPIVLLEDIFKLLDPTELFDLRFLNKYLFNIANNTIKYNLSYSIYYYNVSNQYRIYQQNFIEQNGAMMRHLYLYDDNLELLNNCPNITSLEIDGYIEDQDGESIDHYIEFSIKVNLTKLKMIVIRHSNVIGNLKLFNNYLNQIEVIELMEITRFNELDIYIEDIIRYFNPNKLKSLTLDFNNLNVSGLDTIKTKFLSLKILNLAHCDFTDTSINLNSNVNFASYLKLKIQGHFWDDFDIKAFGNLNYLKQMELKDLSNFLFDMSNSTSLIEKDHLFISGWSSFSKPVDHYLKRLVNSKQLTIDNIATRLFNILPLLPNIQHIFIDRLSMNGYCTSQDSDLNEPSKYKADFIKQIIVDGLILYLDEFLSFLSFFPNLQVIKIRNFNLKMRESTITYNLPTSLLLIAPIPYSYNSELYQALDQIFMLNWIKYKGYF
ncbi:hypothetical protein K502DRAFT_358717 [Neoconidiobolus thromboides FSU 785]|nr:hypothetical protein K502DRAFT_358717 [Neoconidiobolus thromboides FSU 785]